MPGPSDPIGILAGSGSLPVDGARSIVERGGRVHVVMVDGLADPLLTAYPHTIVNWAGVGLTMRAFKTAGVQRVVMLGATGRPSFTNARPDWGFISALPAILRLLRAGGDDAVLRGLIGLFDRNGLQVIGPGEAVPELLIGEGAMTSIQPSANDRTDIEQGFAMIRAIGRYDVGQAVVVIDGRIAAIEGAEGTDRMLQHVAAMGGALNGDSRRGVVVKRPKPGQDMRVDLPTIGPNTAQNAARAGLAGIAVMQDQVLAADRAAMVDVADAQGLFIVGVADRTKPEGLGDTQIDPVPKAWTKRKLALREQRDLKTAAGILARLTKRDASASLVMIEGRVITVGCDERPGDVIERAASIKTPMRRSGLAAVCAGARIDDQILLAAKAANLASIVLVDDAKDSVAVSAPILDRANALGLAVASISIEDR